jgi:hypothetical protein
MNPVTIFRNLDLRTVMGVLSVLTMIETSIVSGVVELNGPGSPIPVTWHDSIIWWCKMFLFLNGTIGITHATTASKWSDDSTALKPPVAKP